MLVEGQAQGPSEMEAMVGRWQTHPSPPYLLPSLATPDPGGRNSGSHSPDEETEVQGSFRPTPILWRVASGMVLILGPWVRALSGKGDPSTPSTVCRCQGR